MSKKYQRAFLRILGLALLFTALGSGKEITRMQMALVRQLLGRFGGL